MPSCGSGYTDLRQKQQNAASIPRWLFSTPAFLGARYYKKRVHDYSFWLDLHDPGVSKQLMIRGSREPEHRYLLRRELKAGMTALDLGANIGYYTVMMAKFEGTRRAISQ